MDTTTAPPVDPASANPMGNHALRGGLVQGGLGSEEAVQPFQPALRINARKSNTHRLSSVITADFTVEIVAAFGGDCGALALTQDGTGGHKITNITCGKYEVQMAPDTLTTINTDAFKGAGASSLLTYQIVGALCIVSMVTATAAAYG